MSEVRRVFGIDLGTTFSCIARVDENCRPVVIPNSENDRTTPSVVYFESEDNVAVGKSARAEAPLSPELVVSAVKRHMGDPEWKRVMQGREITPTDVSAHILQRLVLDAETITGETITDAVITCPAYFGVAQKEATKQAGELAGLIVRYVVPEPTAAAVAYGLLETGGDETILVYDLGGGTFDITVLDIKAGSIAVVCTGGDHNLGGRNWDETLAGFFAEELAKVARTSKQAVKDDKETWEYLMEAAEGVKIGLSSKEKVRTVLYHEGTRETVEVTREAFRDMTDGLLENTLMLTEELLEVARKKGHSRIDKVLLVGGSTHMPQVREALERRFPGLRALSFDPDEVVAKGAALMGLKCEMGDSIEALIERGFPREQAERTVAADLGVSLPTVRDLSRKTIRNVTSKSYGTDLYYEDVGKERCLNLILMDEPVPAERETTTYTLEDGQTGVSVACIENLERTRDAPFDFKPSQVIGTTHVAFTRPLPRGSKVVVRFTLSEDGLLTVYGEDLTTHQTATAVLKSDALLTAEDMERKRRRNVTIKVTA